MQSGCIQEGLWQPSRFVSHRFRGFGPCDNHKDGLQSALQASISHLECDIRQAACGTLVVFHDEYAQTAQGEKKALSAYPYQDYDKLGGNFTDIARLDTCLQILKTYAQPKTRLWLDIKEYGYQGNIVKMVEHYQVGAHVFYISWLADVLYALAPQTNQPLVFSHWHGKINQDTHNTHHVFTSSTGEIPNQFGKNQSTGTRTGWQVSQMLTGEMRTILARSKGGICLPANHITQQMLSYYHAHNIWVSGFGYSQSSHICAHAKQFNLDYYLVDKATLFAPSLQAPR